MDLVILLGLVSKETEPATVVRVLEETLSVFFEPAKTAGVYSAYQENGDVGFSLRFDWPVESAFDEMCPHVLSVDTGVRDKIGTLGAVFAKIAASRKFHAAMTVDFEDIATTRGVPTE